MMRLFEFMLRFMRRHGASVDDGEFRALWVVVTAAYGAVSLVIVTAAINAALRRACHLAIAEHPRRPLRSVKPA